MIDQHIALLLRSDPIFKAYWTALKSEDQEERLRVTREVELQCGELEEPVTAGHEWASEKMRRYLSCVPEMDRDYARFPQAWLEFVRDEAAKVHLRGVIVEVFSRFLLNSSARGRTRLYGDVKPSTFPKKNFEDPEAGTTLLQLRSIWDAVRCRIVCSDLMTLRTVCIEIWQYFIEKIVRCRNYYTRIGPRSILYKAVHFELEIESNRWIELQVVTELREWVGFLDHAFVYKKSLSFVDREHEEWLTSFSAKANIVDARKILDTDVKIPLSVLERFMKTHDVSFAGRILG